MGGTKTQQKSVTTQRVKPQLQVNRIQGVLDKRTVRSREVSFAKTPLTPYLQVSLLRHLVPAGNVDLVSN